MKKWFSSSRPEKKNKTLSEKKINHKFPHFPSFFLSTLLQLCTRWKRGERKIITKKNFSFTFFFLPRQPKTWIFMITLGQRDRDEEKRNIFFNLRCFLFRKKSKLKKLLDKERKKNDKNSRKWRKSFKFYEAHKIATEQHILHLHNEWKLMITSQTQKIME